MANPFDQFDTVQSGNPFDQFDPISDEKKKRSVGEALKDIPASFLTGIGSLAKEPGQLYGLATGDMNPNYTKTGRLISKFAEQMKSPGLKAREEDRARKVAEAEKEGQLSAAATAVGQTIKDPFGLGLSFLAQNAPSMIPALGVGRAVNAGAKVLGATPEIASAIAEYAVKGTMVGQQGTDVGAQAYDDIYQKLIDQKVPPEQAKRQAIELARKAALAGAAVSAGSMMLPGANAFAKYAAKVPGLTKEIEQGGIKSLIPESRLMGAVKGGLGEATQEAAEEGGGQVAQNYAMRQIDPTQSLTGGVGQAAGLGALGGASLGVIGGHGQEPANVPPTATTPPPAAPTTPTAPSGPAPATFPPTQYGTVQGNPPEPPPPLGLPAPEVQGELPAPPNAPKLGYKPFTPVSLPDGTIAATQEQLDEYNQHKADVQKALTEKFSADPLIDRVMRQKRLNELGYVAPKSKADMSQDELDHWNSMTKPEQEEIIRRAELKDRAGRRWAGPGGTHGGGGRWTKAELDQMGIETTEKPVPMDRSLHPDNLGKNGVPIANGGEHFATRDEAAAIKKQSRMKDYLVAKTPQGYVLSPKTDEDIAKSYAQGIKNLTTLGMQPGDIMGAGQFIASKGGLRPKEKSDMRVDPKENIYHGATSLFRPGGMTIEEATKLLKESDYIQDDDHDSAREAIVGNKYNQMGKQEDAQRRLAENRMEEERRIDEANLHGGFSEEMNYPTYHTYQEEADALREKVRELGFDDTEVVLKAHEETLNQPDENYHKRLAELLRPYVTGKINQEFNAKRTGFITTEEERINAEELKGKTFIQAAQWLVDKAPNRFAKIIANKILNRLKEYERAGVHLRFEIATDEKRDIRLRNAAGFTNTRFGANGEQGAILLMLNGPTNYKEQANFGPGTSYRTVFHEMLHAATAAHLEFSHGSDPLIKELNRIYDIVARHIKANRSNKTMSKIEEHFFQGTNNAFSDRDELISWGLTDHDMQVFLSGIKVGDKSVFNMLTEIVRKILGLSPSYDSALDALIRTTDSILDERIEVMAYGAKSRGFTFGHKAIDVTANKAESVNRQADNTSTKDFPNAKDIVSGLKVRDSVPNISSIDSSLDDYTILDGVREIQMSDFEVQGKPKYYSKSEEKRTLDLAEQIRKNKEINPLIVVQDKDGLYILEGGHRWDALRELGIKSFPAIVVRDNESFNNPTEKTSELFNAAKKKVGQATQTAAKAIHKAGQKNIKPTSAFRGMDTTLVDSLDSVFYPENKTIVSKIESLKNDFWERLAQKTVDQFRSIKNIYKLGESPIGYMKARLSQSIDGALEGLVFSGHVYDDGGALNIKTGNNNKGLIETLKPLGDEVDRFQIWMALNREANLPKDKQSPSLDKFRGRAAEFSDGTMEDGKNRLDVFEKVQKDFNALNKSVLKVALDKGLIDKEAFDRFSNDIFYIPFYKVMESGDIGDVQVSAMKTASTLTNQYFSKALKGKSEKPFGDLMGNTLKNWSHILSAAQKNDAAVTVLHDAEKAAIVSKAKPGQDDSNLVKVMENGKQAYYDVHDPFLLESITNITFLTKNSPFLDVAQKFGGLLRFGVTISPAFKVGQLFKDTIQSAALAEVNALNDTFANWADTKRGQPAYIEALAGGAIFNFGSAYEGNQSALIKKLIAQGVNKTSILDSPESIKEGLKTLWQAYEDFGTRTEAVNRMALYKQLKAKGLSHLEASYQARDLLDFSMQGSSGAFRYVTQSVPFLNARLQGLYKLGRDGVMPTSRVIYNTITGEPIEADDAAKAKRFSMVTASTMLASMLLYLAFKDDDDFKRREQWDRDNFWWIKLPGMDSALRIPKPFELGAFGTMAERILEQIVDKDVEGKQFGDSLSRMLTNTFSLNPVPQFVKPMVDLYANKDSFTSAPIETAGMEKLSKQMRVTDQTSPIAVALGGISHAVANVTGEGTELSPVQIDYAIRSYLGWMGGTAIAASQYAVMPFREGSFPDANWRDRISLGYIKALPAKESAYMTSFYQNNQAIQQAYSDMRHYAELGQYDKVIEVQQEKGDLIALQKVYDKTSKEIAKVRQQVRLITSDTEMDGKTKKEEIERLKLLMSDLSQQAESVRKSLKS